MKLRKLQLPEQRLVRLLQEQHPDGARALYDMYSAALLGMIQRIIKDQAQSEDLLQETFIRIWRTISQYDPQKGRLFTWMVNIARNLTIDQLRSKKYQQVLQTLELESFLDLPCAADDTYHRTELYFIRQGVALLKSSEMAIIELVYYRGFTHPEVAEALNLPLGTVKTRLGRALRRLRFYYSENQAACA